MGLRQARSLQARSLLSMAILVLILGTAACAPAAPSEGDPAPPEEEGTAPESPSADDAPARETAVSMGTHETGSAYHAGGSELASLVNTHSDLRVTVRPFAGPQAWMPVLDRGEIELGLAALPDVGWGFTGTAAFDRPHPNVRLLVIGTNTIRSGLAVQSGSEIRQTTDLAGRSVASDYGGNVIIHRINEAHLATVGMTWDDVRPVPVASFGDGLSALREGRVDSAFAGSPTTAIALEVDAAVGIRPLNLADWDPARIDAFPADALAELQSRIPGAEPALLAAGEGYVDEDAIGVGYRIGLVATAGLSDAAAYEIVRAIWDHSEELADAHEYAQGFEREVMFSEQPVIPYHPGAIRFFEEQGLWTETAAANQQRLLEQAR